MKDDARIKRGSKNLFKDLGYADPETHLLKAGLVTRIGDIITETKLTQAEAADRMGLSQPMCHDCCAGISGKCRSSGSCACLPNSDVTWTSSSAARARRNALARPCICIRSPVDGEDHEAEGSLRASTISSRPKVPSKKWRHRPSRKYASCIVPPHECVSTL